MTNLDFAACLTEATDLCEPAMGRKFYLADLFAVVAEYRGLTLAECASLAAACHLAGTIELTRADLVLDASKTEASEVRHETATWHYLELARN